MTQATLTFKEASRRRYNWARRFSRVGLGGFSLAVINLLKQIFLPSWNAKPLDEMGGMFLNKTGLGDLLARAVNSGPLTDYRGPGIATLILAILGVMVALIMLGGSVSLFLTDLYLYRQHRSSLDTQAAGSSAP